MSKSDPELAERRAARNRARAELLRELTQAKADLAPAVLKRRVMAETQRTALSAAHQAVDIASDSRGVIAATGAALVLWFVRKPILAGAGGLIARYRTRYSPAGRAKLLVADYWRKLKDYADE